MEIEYNISIRCFSCDIEVFYKEIIPIIIQNGNSCRKYHFISGDLRKIELDVNLRFLDTLYKKYRYGALKVKIALIGDPYLFPRSIVEVWGIGGAVDGYFWVKEANHELSPGSGFRTTVELNKDGLNKKNKPKQTADVDITGFSEMLGEGIGGWIR